jgi:hypothetical protein
MNRHDFSLFAWHLETVRSSLSVHIWRRGHIYHDLSCEIGVFDSSTIKKLFLLDDICATIWVMSLRQSNGRTETSDLGTVVEFTVANIFAGGVLLNLPK